MRNKFRKWQILSLCLLVFAASGCGDGSSDPVPATGTIRLNNNSNAAIDRFYLVSVEQASLGSDIVLGLLSPGSTMSLPDISPDSYDAKIGVNGQDSDYFAYAYDIPLPAGNTIDLNIYDSSFTGSLEICNTTAAADIIGVYLVAADAASWGENQTASVIGPAGVLHLYDLAAGSYKVKVVWGDLSESLYSGGAGITIGSLTLTTLSVN